MAFEDADLSLLPEGFHQRVVDLNKEGYNCAQIMSIATLEQEGLENVGFVRAMGGLNDSTGHSKMTCGALTSACCIISYFAGKGEDDELEDDDFQEMLGELADWFAERYTNKYGGFRCCDMLHDNYDNRIFVCPEAIGSAYAKAIELLDDRGLWPW
ncbi:MAG: C-GCAxxG-C-C family protein [bacterium]|nr:C-GCAxxG-C-C family protein [bacterium]